MHRISCSEPVSLEHLSLWTLFSNSKGGLESPALGECKEVQRTSPPLSACEREHDNSLEEILHVTLLATLHPQEGLVSQGGPCTLRRDKAGNFPENFIVVV